MPPRKFEGRVVWITGASSGIGEALAYLFSENGARLILSSNQEEELRRVRKSCALTGTYVLALPLDLTQPEEFPAKTAEVIARFGRIDILVNNAGVSHRSLVKDTSLAVLRSIIDTDLTGNAALTCAVLPHLLAQRSGHIVVMSSLAAKMSLPTRSAYCAAKHGLHGFYNALRAEVWRDNVFVTLICPAGVRTNIGLNSLMGDGSKHGKTDKHIANGLSPDICAKAIVKAILHRQEEVWLGGWAQRGPAHIAQCSPGLFSWLLKHVRAFA